jgi:hypothetical protein
MYGNLNIEPGLSTPLSKKIHRLSQLFIASTYDENPDQLPFLKPDILTFCFCRKFNRLQYEPTMLEQFLIEKLFEQKAALEFKA